MVVCVFNAKYLFMIKSCKNNYITSACKFATALNAISLRCIYLMYGCGCPHVFMSTMCMQVYLAVNYPGTVVAGSCKPTDTVTAGAVVLLSVSPSF